MPFRDIGGYNNQIEVGSNDKETIDTEPKSKESQAFQLITLK
ncbi:MAG: hypothetical protein WA364_18350 [Candidatus Nitrosopolaris sp.]